VVRNGSSSRTQFLPKSQDVSGVDAEERSGLYQRRGLALGESRPQTRDYKLWAILEDKACQKRHNNLDCLKRSLVKATAEIRLETVRVAIAEWPEGLKACVEAEGGHFEWHIINKNLKLLLINYWLEKWMFCFIFLLDHNIIGTELMAGLRTELL
jgi:hypothetical protein